MNTKKMADAVWVKCEHGGGDYIDYCCTCAPWWKRYATCPTCGAKLTFKGYCRNCREHFRLGKEA